MPYASDAQRRKFHMLQKEGKIPAATVEEYDQASKGKDLPERVPKKKKVEKKTTRKGSRGVGKRRM